jgi:hypothetical protein
MSKSQEIIPHHVDKGAETPKFNEDFFPVNKGLPLIFSLTAFGQPLTIMKQIHKAIQQKKSW